MVQRLPDGKLDKSGPKVLMVTKISATAVGLSSMYCGDNVALPTDHSGLVKYETRGRGPYQIVRSRIEAMMDEIEG